VVLEGDAQAVLGLLACDSEVLAEVEPAVALRLQVRVVQRARDQLRQFMSCGGLGGYRPLLPFDRLRAPCLLKSA
jgi:hypothetical protein